MKKQKGLGRGLDAIFGSEEIAEANVKIAPMSEMSQVAIDKIIPNPVQPRREFDPQALEELSSSISELGIIQPITVKKHGDKYMIISGERRWRASQMASLETIPAYIREVDDEALHTMALVENIQRENLNPIEIALGMQRLLDECGLTQDALSERISMKRPTISNFLRLLKLPSGVQLALKSGIITMGHAKAIAGVDESLQMELLKRCVERSLSVRQCEELARNLSTPVATKSQSALQEREYPENYSRLMEQLEELFSQDISIKRTRNGGGKIVIEFKSDNDIDKFIKQLNR
ncbi:MAG: ParB/RepB/Spo0J family partition protein [Rikenellaceae bacterium]